MGGGGSPWTNKVNSFAKFAKVKRCYILVLKEDSQGGIRSKPHQSNPTPAQTWDYPQSLVPSHRMQS